MEGQYGGGVVARPCVQQGLLSPAKGIGPRSLMATAPYDVTVKTLVFLDPLVWERIVSAQEQGGRRAR